MTVLWKIIALWREKKNDNRGFGVHLGYIEFGYSFQTSTHMSTLQ